jgi:uncharacterized protein
MTRALIVKCPVCKQQARYAEDNPWQPFCSERCKMVDAGQWLDGAYRVACEEDESDNSIAKNPEQ